MSVRDDKELTFTAAPRPMSYRGRIGSRLAALMATAESGQALRFEVSEGQTLAQLRARVAGNAGLTAKAHGYRLRSRTGDDGALYVWAEKLEAGHERA